MERAKTYFILDQVAKAMEDIDMYISLRPDTDRYLFEGNLHYSVQDFETAILKY